MPAAVTSVSGEALVTVGPALLLIVTLAIVARISRRWTAQPASLAALLESPWAPALAGLVTVAIVRLVWRSLGEPGVVHDERAYLLQAEIFARGHWTVPTPPIPAFFEQMHVFVEPAVFAKYPPGHALMLVPGIWLGLPGLMPAVLAGVAGGLTFWLARRLANVWTALLTWMLWTTAPLTLVWATTYFSEGTSAVMWLIAAWATVRWLDTDDRRYLFGVSAALAWGFETRPLTAIALGAPLAIVILRRLIQTKQWRAATAPMLAGAVLLTLGPLWNRHTLGSWLSDPYPYYSKAYFPFDKPGFGVDPAPPLRPVPRELIGMGEWSRGIHASYVPSAVPLELARRIQSVLQVYGTGWRLLIVLLLFGSLIHASPAVYVSLAACVSIFCAQLVFAQPPEWTVYYVELLPMLHFLAAVGLVRLLAFLGKAAVDANGQLPASVARAAAVATLMLLPFCASDLARVRAEIDRRNSFHRRAAEIVRNAPPHSILFVRYPPTQSPHFGITRNEADLTSARSWVVYDRGGDNAKLLAFAPDRKAYLLDVATFGLEPLDIAMPDAMSQ
jgi:hypothetical protein